VKGGCVKEARDSSRAAIGAIGRFRRVARADWRVCLPRNRVISIDISTLGVAATGFFVRLAAGLISAPFHRARPDFFFLFLLSPCFSSRTQTADGGREIAMSPPWIRLVCVRRRTLVHGAAPALLHIRSTPLARGFIAVPLLPLVHIKKLFPISEKVIVSWRPPRTVSWNFLVARRGPYPGPVYQPPLSRARARAPAISDRKRTQWTKVARCCVTACAFRFETQQDCRNGEKLAINAPIALVGSRGTAKKSINPLENVREFDESSVTKVFVEKEDKSVVRDLG